MSELLIEKDDLSRIDWDKQTEHCHLQSLLKLNVEYRIKTFIEQGLPADWQERFIGYGDILGEKGDVLLYPTKKNAKEFVSVFNGLVYAIAVLAFVPGGIRVLGWHYEVRDGSPQA